MNVTGILLHPEAAAQLESFAAAPAHAVLLAGPAGIGKTYIAAALAGELLGSPTPEQHAYYRVVKSEKGSISIEQIRELVGFFRLKVPGPQVIKRAAVIHDAETMGVEAQNALLKLLEEPPADSVLILTSSHPQRLLTTIRSRLQQLQLAAPEKEALVQHFATLGYEAPVVTASLLRSGTNVAEAARRLEGEADDADTLDAAKRALAGTAYDRMLLVEPLSKQKEGAVAFVDTLATIATASLQTAANRGGAGIARWKSVLEAAHRAQDALERSGNVKLVLTELMLAI